jgi:hypothetical protein
MGGIKKQREDISTIVLGKPSWKASLENLRFQRRIILKLVQRKRVYDRIQWQAVLKTVNNVRVPLRMSNF